MNRGERWMTPEDDMALEEREGLLGAPRLAPSGPPFGRYPRFVAAAVS